MSVDPRENYLESVEKKEEKYFRSSEPVSFDHETIIITDPYYVVDEGKRGDDDWQKSAYGERMDSLGFKKFVAHNTIYGDWSCTVYEDDTKKELGEFCADTGMVGVFSLDEVLKYNPSFNFHTEKPWTTCVIKDFTGDVYVKVEKVGNRGISCVDYEASVVGKGSVNFHSVQTGL